MEVALLPPGHPSALEFERLLRRRHGGRVVFRGASDCDPGPYHVDPSAPGVWRADRATGASWY